MCDDESLPRGKASRKSWLREGISLSTGIFIEFLFFSNYFMIDKSLLRPIKIYFQFNPPYATYRALDFP